jgi:CheY-like chemotaxis protein
MFIQADQSLERTQAGLGVGLTLARRLVELHGGTLEAHSDGPGQGSSFTVRLPLAAARRREDDVAAIPGNDAQQQRYRVLLADDNVDFANTLATLLRRLGHDVLVTHDGEQALREAAGFHPQFAFLDIGLPGRNGYDLARALRLLPATMHTMLVAVTGWGQEKDRKLAVEAGFDRHLVKPVRIAQIEEVLRSARAATAANPAES